MNILWAFLLTINLGGHTITQKYWNMKSLDACKIVRVSVEQEWELINEESQDLHQAHGTSVSACVDQTTLDRGLIVDGLTSPPALDEESTPGTTPGTGQ